MKRLKKIYIEVTNACNLACPFCSATIRKTEVMQAEVFRPVMTKIQGKADILYLHVKGEPLLHPEIGTLLDIATEYGFRVHLTTNGTLLPEKREALAGKHNPERLNISVQSLQQFEIAEQTKMTGDILSASEYLIRKNTPVNPRFLVSLRLWTSDQTEKTRISMEIIEKFYRLESGTIAAALAKKNSLVIHPGLALHAAETFDWPSLSLPDQGEKGFCLGLRDQAGILSDGTVIPCCLDGDGILALGNIFTDSWESIMSSPRARALYKGFSDRKISEPLCRRCTYRSRFSQQDTGEKS